MDIHVPEPELDLPPWNVRVAISRGPQAVGRAQHGVAIVVVAVVAAAAAQQGVGHPYFFAPRLYTNLMVIGGSLKRGRRKITHPPKMDLLINLALAHPPKDPAKLSAQQLVKHIHAAVLISQANGGRKRPRRRMTWAERYTQEQRELARATREAREREEASRRAGRARWLEGRAEEKRKKRQRKKIERGRAEFRQEHPEMPSFSWLMVLSDEMLFVVLQQALDPAHIVPEPLDRTAPSMRDPMARMNAVIANEQMLSMTFRSLLETNVRIRGFLLTPAVRNTMYRDWYQRPGVLTKDAGMDEMMDEDRAGSIGVPEVWLVGNQLEPAWYKDLLRAAVLADYLRWVYRATALATAYFEQNKDDAGEAHALENRHVLDADDHYELDWDLRGPGDWSDRLKKVYGILYENGMLAPGVVGMVPPLAQQPHFVIDSSIGGLDDDKWAKGGGLNYLPRLIDSADVRKPLALYLKDGESHFNDVAAYLRMLSFAVSTAKVWRIPQFNVVNFPSARFSRDSSNAPIVRLRGRVLSAPLLLIDDPIPLYAPIIRKPTHSRFFTPLVSTDATQVDVKLMHLRVPEKARFERWLSRMLGGTRALPHLPQSTLEIGSIYHKEGDLDAWDPTEPYGTLSWDDPPGPAWDDHLVLLLESRYPPESEEWRENEGQVPVRGLRVEMPVSDFTQYPGYTLVSGRKRIHVRSAWERKTEK